MKRPIAVVAVLLAFFACGDDSAGPQPTTTIRVNLDWPMAREDGFIDARWELWLIQDIEDEGTFSSNGTATVVYESYCSEGNSSTGYIIDVSGHFEGGEGQCFDRIMPACSSTEQLFVIDDPMIECGPPPS
jgi:hypothetical protein